MQTRVYLTCCLTLGKASVVGFSKQPLLSPHSMLASWGSRTSLCATTSHAMSTAYTSGQQRDDMSKSTWSLVLSLCTIYFVAEITCMHVRTQSINNRASRLNVFWSLNVPDDDSSWKFYPLCKLVLLQTHGTHFSPESQMSEAVPGHKVAETVRNHFHITCIACYTCS